ncbi:MAG: hypothetical protein QOF78_212 [Phycisphaerales bacterium]|jgi:hypothetical protein|nr:hypothetical protein [Phycisphaerales bacterium]MEA2735073.1 hypothetical protein [Humisphaera sp.]
MKVVGLLILVLGIGLFIGNISGAFPTFSGAGWITIIVGGAIMRADGGE